jgi:hypothetical protein
VRTSRQKDNPAGCRGRLIGLLLMGAVLGLIAPAGIAAQTMVETGVTVTTLDAGSFSVSFAPVEGGNQFVGAAGSARIPISAIEGATATAIVKLAWSDTRVTDHRSAYTIAIGASDLISDVTRPDGAGVYTIPASNLALIEIGGEPLAAPLALDQPRMVFASAIAPPAGDGELRLLIRLDVPPSSYPTTYKTTLHVDVTLAIIDGL